MIPSAPTSLSVSPSPAAGKAPGAVAGAAGAGSFSALLDRSENIEEETADAQPSPDASARSALAALLLTAAVGNTGKPTGKSLPGSPADDTPGAAGDTEAGTDTETDSTALEMLPDPAAISLVLAGMLPLPQGQLKGTEATATAQTGSTVAAAQPAGPGMAGAAATSAALSPALNPQALATQAQAQVQTQVQAPAPITVDPAIANVALGPITVQPEQPANVPAAPSDTVTATAAQLATRPQPATTIVAAQQAQLAEGGQAPSDTRATDADLAVTEPTEAGSAKSSAKQLAAARTEPASPLARMTVPVPNAADLQQPAAATPAAPTVQTSSANGTIEGPQDFSTLVSRLAEAREAANPNLVRTTINHTEFGQISLQFRHEDNALAVTMANADPAFTNAVQAAASASLAGSFSGNGSDTPQQQQHSPASSQNQAGVNNPGAGMGQSTGQDAQARAEQAGQSTNRGQGTASLPLDQEASAPRQSRDGTRSAGGIYA